MKICLICWNLYSYGGIQRVLATILNELVKHSDIEITILMEYSKDDDNVFNLTDKVKVVNYKEFKDNNQGLIKKYSVKIVKKINKYTGIFDKFCLHSFLEKIYFCELEQKRTKDFIEKNKFNYVIGVGPSMALFLSSIADELNCKCIGWMHSTFELYYKIKGEENYGLYLLSQKMYKKLDYLIVLTDRDKYDFETEFGEKSVRLYNPVNYITENPMPRIDKPIVFIGRMVRGHKGLDYLVEIIDLIHKKDAGKKFVLIGDGPDFPWVKDEINKRNLIDCVTLTGMKNNVSDYLCNASMFVHTSRYEGFGVVIVEAMMYGLPVVAFHNNGPDEIIADGEDGYLLDKYDCNRFADKVLDILKDQEKYQEMSKKAYKKALHYTPEKIADQFIDILTNQ